MSTRLVLEDGSYRARIEETALTAEAINPGDHNPGELTKAVRVESISQAGSCSIIILCSYMSDLDNAALLKGNQLILMLNNELFRINMEDCTVQHYKQLDIMGSTFGLYETSQGYIVHGELDILMLDSNFELLWDFSGRDIFVSVTGKTAFKLTETTIQLFDFEDNYYEIDLNGRLVNQRFK